METLPPSVQKETVPDKYKELYKKRDALENEFRERMDEFEKENGTVILIRKDENHKLRLGLALNP